MYKDHKLSILRCTFTFLLRAAQAFVGKAGPFTKIIEASALLMLHGNARNQVPGNVLPVLERIMNAQTTESEKTDTQVFSVYISIASVKENWARFSAQLRSRSASAAYNALPCKIWRYINPHLKRFTNRRTMVRKKCFGAKAHRKREGWQKPNFNSVRILQGLSERIN